MSDKIELLPCPFCGQQDAFAEQLDSDASVVICQGRIDEYSACLARGPVGVQESDDEDQPGKDAAIREWNHRAAIAQQPAPAVPGIDGCGKPLCGGIEFAGGHHPLCQHYAAPAAPVAQEPVAWEYRAHYGDDTVTPGWGAWERIKPGGRYSHETVESRVAEIQNYIDRGYRYELRALYAATPSAEQLTGDNASPVAEQQDHSGEAADMVWCACGDGYPAASYDAGFIHGSGMCQNCDAAIPARDIKPDTVEAPRELLERVCHEEKWHAEMMVLTRAKALDELRALLGKEGKA